MPCKELLAVVLITRESYVASSLLLELSISDRVSASRTFICGTSIEILRIALFLEFFEIFHKDRNEAVEEDDNLCGVCGPF